MDATHDGALPLFLPDCMHNQRRLLFFAYVFVDIISLGTDFFMVNKRISKCILGSTSRSFKPYLWLLV